MIKDDFASPLTWAHESAEPADGVDVAVSHRGHGDDGPVQRGGHRVEHGPLLVLLTHIRQAWEIKMKIIIVDIVDIVDI